jgi:dienelactone hydrolase
MRHIVSIVLLFLASFPARAADADVVALAKQLRELDSRVLPKGVDHSRMLSDDIRKRIQEANERETAAWKEIKTREQWERYRDKKVKALRDSLSLPDGPRGKPTTHVTGTIKGDGYIIENLVFESRPGLWVTANLYQPARPRPSMEAIILCHSHHAPKWQGELQDMGITWARLGCAVLVMDQLGHGERRQHPFVEEKSFAGKFRPSRQDYYFRYNVALQLELVGESLMGWMVWDLMRGIDLLCSMPRVDDKNIFLLGSVAGGGDPAAVAAALDKRIKCVVPFNFGGPQPETTFPLPADPEKAFNYAGSGSWESTRNLRCSIKDGFFPWVIVGAAAPRYLIYAHEFAWDQDHDPVWKRLETIYSFYDADDNLDSAHGRGRVTGQPPEATHCTNIGPEHRKQIYQSFWNWFEIPISKNDRPDRRTVQELTCLTTREKETLKPPTAVQQLFSEQFGIHLDEVRRGSGEFDLGKSQGKREFAKVWTSLLGEAKPSTGWKTENVNAEQNGEIRVERVVLSPERNIVVPLLLLHLHASKENTRRPLVIGLAQNGKESFLKQRSEAIADLLASGSAVCLPDLRGCGETRPGDGRGRQSAATSISSSELMLGETMLGSRLRDLRTLLAYLRTRPDIDAKRIALWGDSFAPVNPFERDLTVPLDAEKLPDQCEPLGGILALIGALSEEDVQAVSIEGSLVSYFSLFQSQFCYVPHDVVFPQALWFSEFVPATLVPRPLRVAGLVDGLNRRVDKKAVEASYKSAIESYARAGAKDRLQIDDYDPDHKRAARWLIEQLKAR